MTARVVSTLPRTLRLLGLGALLFGALVLLDGFRVNRGQASIQNAPQRFAPDVMRNEFFSSPLMFDKELLSIFNELDHSHFDVLMSDPFVPNPFVPLRGVSPTPVYGIKEDDSAVTVTVQVPDMNLDDVKIELIDGSVLHIHGKRSTGSSFLQFEKMFALGRHMDPDHIEASLKNGELKITTPKVSHQQEKQVRKIDVKTEL